MENCMATNTALIEKREDLKRRLAAGEYKTLVDVFLTSFSRLIQRLTRRSSPIPVWLTTIILSFISASICIAALYLAGELTVTPNYFERLGIEYRLGIVWAISINVLLFVDIALFNFYINRIFALWQNHMLDATESVTSLEKFNNWLQKVCNRRLHFLVIIIVGMSFSLVIGAVIFLWNHFIGSGSTFGLVMMSILISSSVYLFWMAILLSVTLLGYELKLFPADPSSSELISRLSKELSFFVYIVAVSGAVGALTTALTGKLRLILGIAQVILVWLPLIAMFILNQMSLSSIIRRIKWKTLNEIQIKVEKLQASKGFGNQETMNSINRLMDYHDRVKATRNSTLNSDAILGFINSLLLPLLAFILGNLDLVWKLFGRTP
jgi:hypothetical protein